MATKIQVAIEKEEHRTSKHSENHTQDNHTSSPSSLAERIALLSCTH